VPSLLPLRRGRRFAARFHDRVGDRLVIQLDARIGVVVAGRSNRDETRIAFVSTIATIGILSLLA